MKRYKSYSKYQNSGIDWLGEVPLEWGPPKKISFISSLKGRLGWQGLKAEEYRNEGPHVVSSAHFDNFKIQWDECPRVSVERYQIDDNIQLAEGDLLLMKDGAAMGKLAYVDHLPGPACVNSHLLLFRPMHWDGVDSYLPKFAFYFMRTSLFQEFIKTNGTGATFLGISQEAISRYQVIWPPINDQKSIVSFLDRETGKLDLLIREQKELITLLQEKRQALISNAVTKGLNPKAKMKDSGVEWLGEVPDHWEFPPLHLRFSIELGKMLDEKKISGNSLVPYLRNVDVQWGRINYNDLPEMDIEKSEYLRYTIERGDLLVCEGGEVGRAAIVGNFQGTIGFQKALHRLRARNKDESPKFMYYTLYWAAKTGIFTLEGASTIAHLTGEQLRSYRFPKPPRTEQIAIANFLDPELEKIDVLISEAEETISLMHEHRDSLISEAVTGKIDVRHLA